MPHKKDIKVTVGNLFKHLVIDQDEGPLMGTYSGPKNKRELELLQELIDKVDALNRRIDLIFGDHILMNGYFKDIRS